LKVYTSNIEPLHAELEHFVNCVRGNQPSVGGEQALKALRLIIEQMALDVVKPGKRGLKASSLYFCHSNLGF